MAIKKRSPRAGFDQFPIRIGNTKVVEIGDYVAVASGTGDVEVIADTAGLLPVGFIVDWNPPNADTDGDGAITGDTTATEPVEAVIDIGGRIEDVAVTGVVGQQNIGEKVFATGPNTFTLTATANIKEVGVILRIVSGTTVSVKFYGLDRVIRGVTSS